MARSVDYGRYLSIADATAKLAPPAATSTRRCPLALMEAVTERIGRSLRGTLNTPGIRLITGAGLGLFTHLKH
jgi:hypothetical protein